MKISNLKRNSIAFRMAVIFIVAVFAQCAVMFFMLVTGGALREIQENAYTYFSLQVETRKGNLEGQIKNLWTNFGDYPSQISRQFDIYRESELSEDEQNQEALRASTPYLLEILNNTKTTGVFLILDDEKNNDNQHSAVYIRNTDVDKAGAGNFTLSLMAGPIDIAQDYKFSTNENWSWKLQLNEENNSFYKKTYQNVSMNEDKNLLCYWSTPFTLTNDNEKILTYSIPMTDSKGDPIGVFGVELTVNHLYKFLPKNDMSSYSSLGYILGMKESEDGPIFPIMVRGAEQLRMLDLDNPLSLVEKNADLDIYEIENVSRSGEIFGSFKQMGMYYNNTPHSNEQWYLIGLEESSELLKFSNNVFNIMIFSLAATVLFGIIVAIISSRAFSIPVVRLAKEVKNLSRNDLPKEKLSVTGLAEIDELSDAIIDSQKKLLELNAKLKHERDRDPLTGIKNRHAFNIEKEYYIQKNDSTEKIGIGIFDLNGLKYINDNYGHAEGDYYLCTVSDSICKVFKECSIFRIGGDEFAIILVNMDEKFIESKYEELCSLVEKNERHKMFKGGVAFGYSYFDPSTDSGLEQVMNRADTNMYEVKKRMKKTEI